MSGPFRSATSADTRFAGLSHELGRADQAFQEGRLADAEQTLRKVMQEFPNSVDALNSLTIVLRAADKFQEAQRLLTHALRVAPNIAPLQNNFGNLMQRMGRPVEAEKAYRTAIGIDSGFAEAYYNLGVTLHGVGRVDEALAMLKQACAYRPHYADALTLLGAIQGERLQVEESVSALDSAVAADPRHYGAHYYRGVVMSSLGRHGDAIAMLEQATSLKPNNYEAFLALGNAYARAGRAEQALTAYARAIDLAPEETTAHYAYNSLAHTMGRSELAYTSYAKARRAVGDKPSLLLAEADQRLHRSDARNAEPLLRRAHEIAPERADVMNALARSLALQKRFGDSVEILEKAVKIEPKAIAHRIELGSALLQDRQLNAARQVLEETLALAPNDQFASAYLSLVYRELGDSRYDTLFDIDKYVRVIDIAPPKGFADIESFHQLLMEDLLRLHNSQVEPFDQTLRGGTQTTGHLFATSAGTRQQPLYEQLAAGTRAKQLLYEQLTEAVAGYIRDLPDDPSRPFLARKAPEFTYTGAWSARLKSSGYHTNHVHPEGWISSAYYVSLPEEVQNDTAGHQGWLKFGESDLRLGERDRPMRLIAPKVGRLVLFPSYFWHGTMPFVSGDARLSVAFDVAPGKLTATSGKRY